MRERQADIQAQILAESHGFSDAERHRRDIDIINADSFLGPYYRQMLESGQVIRPAQAARVAEAEAPYGLPE